MTIIARLPSRAAAAGLLRTSRLFLVAGLALSLSALIPTPLMGQTSRNASTLAAGAKSSIDARDAAQNVPIKRITLYRSGVGYFERTGLIDGNSELQLRFNTDQINDILKSMVLLELNGGRVDSVSYGSKEPLSKRLASFGIDIADNPSASEILQRLRGTPVKIMVPEGQFSGTIMNVETRPTVYPGSSAQGSNTSVFQLPWINLLTAEGVRSFNFANVTGFEILDKSLADELNKALGALAEYRADRTKTVDIRFTGAGSRRVVVGYVHEMPVWKTSYRLVLPDSDKQDGTAQVLLQGWAIVENTTDQDWTDVGLSLVSGRPVGFQMDLYEPLFMPRPWVNVPVIPGVSPRGYALGQELDFSRDRASLNQPKIAQTQLEMMRNVGGLGKARSAERGAPAASPSSDLSIDADGRSADFYGVSAAQIADYSPSSRATAAEVGEVFQFQVDQPISIERQRSAMIPILSANITGRRVSIFNASDGQPYPRRGIEIKNDSDLQLLAGPVSVLDSAAGDNPATTYAGDAQIGQIPKGDKRLLAYALDLNVNVTTKSDQNSTITKIRIVNGLFEQTTKRIDTATYEFANREQKRPRTIIVEHPRLNNWTLVEPSKPSELTPDIYRFELAADAGKSAKLVVTQEIIESQRLSVSSYDLAAVAAFHKDGKLSDAVVKAIRDIAARQSEINQVERQIELFQSQTDAITQEQSRIRSNMNTIDRNSQLYTKYMTKLSEQETRLETISTSRDEARARLEDLRRKLEEFLGSLNVE